MLARKVKRLEASAKQDRSVSSEHVTIRSYQSGDEHDLVTFLGGPFDHAAGLEHYRWKLRHWPSTAANVWLGTAGGKPVFHYGGIPLRFSLNGSVVPAMISVDAMTAPKFRRQGLLTRGASSAFAEWKARSVAFTLGLPNERWGSRVEALGWQRLFPLQWLIRPLRPEVFAARRLGIPWLRHATIIGAVWKRMFESPSHRHPQIELEEITRVDDRFDDLWDRLRKDAGFCAVRDSAWVQWRFLSSPSRKYDVTLARRGRVPVGYAATYIARDASKTSAFLAELIGLSNDPSGQESLLAEVIASANDAGADVVAALAVPGTAPYALLLRARFLRGPAFPVHIVPFADLPISRMREPGNWYLNGADFDVI